jgi:hypothetical protein
MQILTVYKCNYNQDEETRVRNDRIIELPEYNLHVTSDSLTCCTGVLKPRMACCSLVASNVGGIAPRGFLLSAGSARGGDAWPGAVADTPAHFAQAAFISWRTSFTTSDPKQLSYTCTTHANTPLLQEWNVMLCGLENLLPPL